MVRSLVIASISLLATGSGGVGVIDSVPATGSVAQAAAGPAGGSSFGALNLIVNGGFEGEGGWDNAYDGPSVSGRRIWRVVDGRWSLWINDTGPDSAEGWRSRATAIAGGVTYRARAQVYRLEGQAPFLYLKYYDGAGAEIASRSVEAAGPLGTWQTLDVELRAPTHAAEAAVVAYSSAGRVGAVYFDNVGLTRAQSAIDNEDFQLEAVGAGHPAGWGPWGGATGPVSVATDPSDSQNRTLKLDDASPTLPAASSARFAADGGILYLASAQVRLGAGSDRVSLYVKYFNASGTEIGSSWGQSPATADVWASISLTTLAPPGTAFGRVVAYCSASRECSAQFDHVRILESWPDVRYVAATSLGDGTGSSGANAARYDEPVFWAGVQGALQSRPVRVVFVAGSYDLSGGEDRLVLTGLGDATHRLHLTGADVYGTELRATGSFAAQMMALHDSTNFTVSNLHFTAAGSEEVYAALMIRRGEPGVSRSIVVEGVQVADLPGARYAGLSLTAPGEGEINGIRAAYNGFVRAGGDGGYHHIYATHSLTDLVIARSYFEDSTGTYVKLRADIDEVAVTASVFHNTGTWWSNNTAMLQLAVYNDVSPGDEWFGGGHRVERNEFRYASASSCALDACNTVSITHQGYNPVDDRGVERDHLLDSAKRAVMLDRSSSNIASRRAILTHDFQLVPNDCGAGVCLDANRFAGQTRRFVLYTTHNYGAPDQGGSGTYDLTNLFHY